MSPTLSPLGVASLAVVTLVAAFPIGYAVLGDRTPDQLEAAAAPDDERDERDGPASGSGALSTASSCADLLDALVTEAEPMVGPWGWDYGMMGRGALNDVSAELATTRAPAAATDAVTKSSQSSSETGTNVQESGVDEPDVAKTDGKILVRVDRRTLSVFDLSGTAPRKVASLPLPRIHRGQSELLLDGDRLLVVADTWRRNKSATVVTSVDLADPAKPELRGTQEIDGSLISARLTGDVVRLVTSTGLPNLDFVRPSRKRSNKEALQENQRVLADSTIDQWLPQVVETDASGDAAPSEPLVDCSNVNLPETIGALGMLNVVGFTTADPNERDSTTVVTDSRIAYTSTDRLYVTSGSGWLSPVIDTISREFWPGSDDGTTEVHAFALDATTATYRASGTVDGSIADRWAMDSADGILRVATTSYLERGKGRAKRSIPSSSVITFAEQDGELVEQGAVDDLGVNENIQSVRWFDDLAIVVTFRQVDPLYAIDLSTPERPELLGELKIPGFSSYLHPIGDDRLLGLGTDATKRGRSLGAQAATFDLSDPTSPVQVDKVTYGRNSELMASWEPRQFTWLEESRTALTVVARWGRRAELAISELSIGADGTLTERRIPVAGGYRAYEVRTVPLPDGRVVVTSRVGTSFLDLRSAR